MGRGARRRFQTDKIIAACPLLRKGSRQLWWLEPPNTRTAASRQPARATSPPATDECERTAHPTEKPTRGGPQRVTEAPRRTRTAPTRAVVECGGAIEHGAPGAPFQAGKAPQRRHVSTPTAVHAGPPNTMPAHTRRARRPSSLPAQFGGDARAHRPIQTAIHPSRGAISAYAAPSAFSCDPHTYLRSFLNVSAYTPGAIMRAGVTDLLAGRSGTTTAPYRSLTHRTSVAGASQQWSTMDHHSRPTPDKGAPQTTLHDGRGGTRMGGVHNSGTNIASGMTTRMAVVEQLTREWWRVSLSHHNTVSYVLGILQLVTCRYLLPVCRKHLFSAIWLKSRIYGSDVANQAHHRAGKFEGTLHIGTTNLAKLVASSPEIAGYVRDVIKGLLEGIRPGIGVPFFDLSQLQTFAATTSSTGAAVDEAVPIIRLLRGMSQLKVLDISVQQHSIPPDFPNIFNSIHPEASARLEMLRFQVWYNPVGGSSHHQLPAAILQNTHTFPSLKHLKITLGIVLPIIDHSPVIKDFMDLDILLSTRKFSVNTRVAHVRSLILTRISCRRAPRRPLREITSTLAGWASCNRFPDEGDTSSRRRVTTSNKHSARWDDATRDPPRLILPRTPRPEVPRAHRHHNGGGTAELQHLAPKFPLSWPHANGHRTLVG
ncbi:hypothetical protein BJ912DRAFT_1088111 [Pholiota molesta]|nr:hypothetical protein BJ912DRAFT_1088111 [Pholiota molesta]